MLDLINCALKNKDMQNETFRKKSENAVWVSASLLILSIAGYLLNGNSVEDVEKLIYLCLPYLSTITVTVGILLVSFFPIGIKKNQKKHK